MDMPMTPSRESLGAEVLANYEVFKATLPDLVRDHVGRFAVYRHRELAQIFDPKSGSYFSIRPPICGGAQPAVGGQAGFNRSGGSSLRPLRKYRSASLRMRYHRCSVSNCSAVFRSSARKPAIRT